MRHDRFFDVSPEVRGEPVEVTVLYPWRDTLMPGNWAESRFAIVRYDETGRFPTISCPGSVRRYCRFAIDALCERLLAEDWPKC